MIREPHESKTKLLDAALKVVRTKGYNATRIEDICAEAGLTKGSFFHHFKSKDELALAAMAHYDSLSEALFASAPYHDAADPLSRLISYVEFRKAILRGDLPDFTCFAGTIVQEAYRTHPDLAAAGERSIVGHAKVLEADVRAAMREHGIRRTWTAKSLTLYMQAVIQGSLILAKATGSAKVAAESLDHLRRYLELLFDRGRRQRLGGSRSKGR